MGPEPTSLIPSPSHIGLIEFVGGGGSPFVVLAGHKTKANCWIEGVPPPPRAEGEPVCFLGLEGTESKPCKQAGFAQPLQVGGLLHFKFQIGCRQAPGTDALPPFVPGGAAGWGSRSGPGRVGRHPSPSARRAGCSVIKPRAWRRVPTGVWRNAARGPAPRVTLLLWDFRQ